jgi:antirestriction protein ArdC
MFWMTKTVNEKITARIIAAIAKGQTPPWRRPIFDFENDGFPTHPATPTPFRGVNVLLLNISATERGYRSKFWSSEQEWRTLGSIVSGRPTLLPDGTAVFNGDQTNSFAHHSRKRTTPVAVDYQSVEALIAASGADIRFGGNEAAYYYRQDYIAFPEKWRFVEGPGGISAYYDSLFHELAGHWTEFRLEWSRLQMSLDPVVNELRAEIAAPFMTAQLGLPVFSDMKILSNHRNHLARWAKAMNTDPSLIFHVAAAASDAAEYLLSLRGN